MGKPDRPKLIITAEMIGECSPQGAVTKRPKRYIDGSLVVGYPSSMVGLKKDPTKIVAIPAASPYEIEEIMEAEIAMGLDKPEPPKSVKSVDSTRPPIPPKEN